MNREGETDHLLRLLRGYRRLYLDPPQNNNADPPWVVKSKAALLIVNAFAELDEALVSGAPLPEEWDGAMYHRRRETRGKPREWLYTYPPGATGNASCEVRGRQCRWIDRRADETACRRCHTIRVRVKVSSGDTEAEQHQQEAHAPHGPVRGRKQ